MSNSALQYPCGECGAEPGQPCPEGCLGAMDWQPDDVYATPCLEDSQAALMASVYRLPFSQFLPDPPDRRESDLETWMAELAVWMADYLPVLRQHVDKLSRDAGELIGIRMEREMVDAVLRRALSGSTSISTTSDTTGVGTSSNGSD